MGFAVSWITPLVVGALVDRNAIATKDLRSNLNWIFAGALEGIRLLQGQYNKIVEVDNLPKGSNLRVDAKLLGSMPEDIFTEFAGQGRLRWHRGVAHAILTGIEKSCASEHGRGWLEDGELARVAMLIPHGDKGFNVVDRRLLQQAIAAFMIIYGNLGAGFLISYFTPPVGISCRALGYLIFGTSTLAAATIEIIFENGTSPTSAARRSTMPRNEQHRFRSALSSALYLSRVPSIPRAARDVYIAGIWHATHPSLLRLGHSYSRRQRRNGQLHTMRSQLLEQRNSTRTLLLPWPYSRRYSW